jgi:hypothetical protein
MVYRRLNCTVFRGLHPEQIYSPEDPVLLVASANSLSKYMVSSAISESNDGACEGSASPS